MVGWTFARSYSAIIVFSVLNGLIGCWFLGLLPVVCAELFGVEGLSTITGFMILMNSPVRSPQADHQLGLGLDRSF